MAVNPDSIPRYAPPTDPEPEPRCEDCDHMVLLPIARHGRGTTAAACVAAHDVDGAWHAKWCDADCVDCRLYKRAARA